MLNPKAGDKFIVLDDEGKAYLEVECYGLETIPTEYPIKTKVTKIINKLHIKGYSHEFGIGDFMSFTPEGEWRDKRHHLYDEGNFYIVPKIEEDSASIYLSCLKEDHADIVKALDRAYICLKESLQSDKVTPQLVAEFLKKKLVAEQLK